MSHTLSLALSRSYHEANSRTEQERLPYELGWTPPLVETNFPTLAVMAQELLLANPEEAAQNFPDITADLLKDVYQLENPVTGVICNATRAAAGLC